MSRRGLSRVMKKILSLILILVVTGASVGFVTVARAAAVSRRIVDDNDRVRLHGSVHPLARPEFDRGSAPSSLPMERMILSLRRDAVREAELEKYLMELHDPASPNFHRWLTPEEFGERFGPSSEDIDDVSGWLTSHGFVIEEVGKGRSWINFSGTADQVQRAFRTEIHGFYADGRLRHANDRDPSIPRALADLVSGVVSLNDFPRKQMHHVLRPVAQTDLMPDYTAGSSHYLSPGDFAIIYNVSGLYSAGIDGSGQSIAIVGRTHPPESNWATFRSMMALPANPPQVIVNGPDPGDLGAGEDTEADLDVEWSGAVAKNATIKFVISKSTLTTDGVDLSAQYVVNNNLAPVMSTSFGACEADLGTAGNNFYKNLWQQAATQGITSFVSSGDSGAAGCDPPSASDGTGSAVNGLASTPYNAAVGGTQFNEGSGSYWNPNNGTGYTSAISYIPEVAWNESGSVSGGSGLWSTGGGASSRYTKPSWQAAPGVPANNSRNVPDVSLTAAGHVAYLIQTQGALYAVRGTSASSPAFAGLMALVVQKTGQRQGNANPRFYQLGNAQFGSGGATVFHDISSGNNTVPGVTGYASAAEYDLATGLGSVDASALVNNWTSDFTIAASPTALSIPRGSMGTSTISTTVLGNFSNAVSLSASGLPAGVTATFNPSAIAAPGSGSSTMTLTVGSSAPTGTFPVTVTGIGGGMTHTAAVNLTVLQIFTITSSVAGGIGGAVSPSTATVVSGGNVTLTISPNIGYHLVSLTDNGLDVTASVSNGTYTLSNVTANHTMVAAFAISTYGVTASVSGGNGTVNPSSTLVNYGGSAAITIIPATGYHLAILTDNGINVTSSVIGNSYTITNVTGPRTVVAAFSINMYNVTASIAAGNGSITPASASVAYGGAVTFTIIPDTGYTLSGLTDNGAPGTAAENPPGGFKYTTTNVSADHTVRATFSQLSATSVPAMGLWGFGAAVCGLIWIALKRKRRNI